jgi:hypothetical protein
MMTNLLTNPGFEGEYYAWHGLSDIMVAQGWVPYWIERRSTDEEWRNRRPVYRAATVAAEAIHIRSGRSAQGYLTNWATHTAGLLQQITVTAGQRLRFKAYGHAWSSNEDNPESSIQPGNVRMKIGIDPTGGANPLSATVVWSPERTVYDRYDDGFTVEAAAQGTAVTVFLFSAPEWPKKHNNVYWDEASLEAIAGAPAPSAPAGGATLVMESQTRQVNQPVAVRATHAQSLTNVHLSVSGPSGAVSPRWLGVSAGGQGYIWRWEFTPAQEGPYTATFGADLIESASATINIVGLVETPSTGSEQPAPSGRGQPRAQYERTYVLLPQSYGRDWLQAILDSGLLERYKWTIGFSADDAGIGDLDVRNVVIVNPSAWSDPIAPWFELWYPGVRLRIINAANPQHLEAIMRTF